MLIDQFMPVGAFQRAGMIPELLNERIHSRFIFLLARFTIQIEQDFTGIDIIYIVCFHMIQVDFSFIINQ